LPGPHGIGDLGPEAYRFVDFLVEAGQSLWQILPLGPPGFGHSPYAAHSAFAGNPLLISLERLAKQGIIEGSDVPEASIPQGPVDFDAAEKAKLTALRKALSQHRAAESSVRERFEEFRNREAAWLADYALFAALSDAHGGTAWQGWRSGLARRRPDALEAARSKYADEIELQEFMQYLFWDQWDSLRRYANERGVRFIGDIPIFVSLQSADVWAHPELFSLNQRGAPTFVAGVPPDAFSATGQRWGNPLYRWDVLQAEGYGWWIERFRSTLRAVDFVRLDHFRGFAAYYEIPARSPTAERGRWVPGPGIGLFEAARAALGELPIIVEDLGLITPDVVALREELGYPGMRVLHFAFGGGADNPYLPHNFEPNVVAYTGTHDNDTTVGWYTSSEGLQHHVRSYLGSDGSDIAWDLIRLALASVADRVVIPVQDVLGLGAEARMNYPGRSEGNWAWRLSSGQLRPEHAERLRELTQLYGRLPPADESRSDESGLVEQIT
jgi:4-alpha-glucanotransferase